MVRTNNLGHVALGSTLSITNGTPAEVRGYIVEREQSDKARRAAMTRAKTAKIKARRAAFTDYIPQPHPLYN